MSEESTTQGSTPVNQSSSGLSTADLATTQTQPNSQPEAQGDTTTDMPSSEATTEVETRPVGGAQDQSTTPLFAEDEASGFRSRWTEIQSGFVDEPRQAVEQADGLVAEVMQRLAQTFADERNNLEDQWQQGDNISTEDLRVALQRYRSFFDRLLSV